MGDADKFTKLPEFAKPTVYDVKLAPCLKSFTFNGVSSVTLNIFEKTKFLKLHAKELEINSTSIELSNGEVLNGLDIKIDNKWNLLTINLPKEIEPQSNVKVNFNFRGELNDKMQGFSRSKYTDSTGAEKYMASTQFESTYARSAFPCWDEPVYKAKFNIALEVDEGLTALSNMNVIEEKKDGSKKIVKYAETPIMSSYLVAFAVGDFEYIETKSKGGIIVRVYTIPGKKQEGEYALDLAAKCLDWYAVWFGIPCPLPKCDLIAIPDFSMGAMENWGLVTYREVCLLVDPIKTSTLVKAHVAMVVAHELAHFWFGNLVTMKWWTDLWLKEGFASFMEYLFVGSNCPEFKIWLHFVNDEVARGFDLDALRSSHPIEVPIDNPNELDEIYDSITYAKSNSINRMLYNFLGEPVFQKGLQIYLKNFQYSNAETLDLWKALSEASGQNVSELMSSWTKQMGFPLVTVEQKVDGKKRFLKLTQERFIADGGKDELNSIWQIPINVVSDDSPLETKAKLLFTKQEQEFVIDNINPDGWIKLNGFTSGFFRVQYPVEMLKSLFPAIQNKRMGALDRFGVANDLFALVMANKINAGQFLEFFGVCNNEDEYIVWSAIDQGISQIANVLMHNDATLKTNFDAYVCKILEPLAQRLGWTPAEGEDSQIGLLRALILGRLAKCGHSATIQHALKLFVDHADNKVNIVADLRGVLYGVAGRSNDPAQIERLQKIFETVGFSEVENSCVVAMSQCSDDTILRGIFDYGIVQGKIRSQDLPRFFLGTQVSKKGKEFAWKFFKENCPLLLKKFGSVNSSLFQGSLKICGKTQCSEDVAKDIEKFAETTFDPHSLAVLNRPIRQILESIRNNEQLLKNNADVIGQFLASRN